MYFEYICSIIPQDTEMMKNMRNKKTEHYRKEKEPQKAVVRDPISFLPMFMFYVCIVVSYNCCAANMNSGVFQYLVLLVYSSRINHESRRRSKDTQNSSSTAQQSSTALALSTLAAVPVRRKQYSFNISYIIHIQQYSVYIYTMQNIQYVVLSTHVKLRTAVYDM